MPPECHSNATVNQSSSCPPAVAALIKPNLSAPDVAADVAADVCGMCFQADSSFGGGFIAAPPVMSMAVTRTESMNALPIPMLPFSMAD